MTITARYPGKCKKCGGAIHAGDKIEWDSATKSTTHVTCPAKPQPVERPAKPEVSVFPARFESSCSKCGGSIKVGEKIEWNRRTGAANHISCPAALTQSVAPGAPTYEIGGGSGYGYHGWQPGQVVRADARDIEQRGYPEWLVVLSARQKYYSYDGLSFGVGDDRGYYYSATCRDATPEEAAPMIAKRQAALALRAAKARLDEIKRDIQARGSRPERSESNARGERLIDTQNAYGGGDWFVLNEREIWYVRNNGMDGDNWSANNVFTGGAGAIGWVVLFDEALAAELRKLAEIVTNKE